VELDELERLYRERYSVFLGLALGVSASREDARDAVQEGFAQAVRRRWTYRGRGTPEAWVWRIVLRTAIDDRRRSSRHGHEELEQEDLRLALPYPERDPELAAALRALPPRRRLIVFLRYFADLDYEEIARICGITTGAVSAALSKGRAELLAALGAGEAAGEERL
jgi:RNA polymerase sigma-70 factor, ECF subfamily